MGTNYYVDPEAACPTCGRGDEPLHIGLSSAGWVFKLRVYPDLNINSLDDWKAFLLDKVIRDEYGREVSYEGMLSEINARARSTPEETPYGYSTWAEFHYVNNSRMTRFGLLCTEEARDFDGTYELIDYEFS